MRIDAHQHFWQPLRGDYDWMPKDNATLNRPYSPADLGDHLSAAGVDGTVLIQAAATVDETEYMLGLADATPFIKGVVGWIDFESPAQLGVLKRLAAHPKFLGVRPMIQDIPDLYWMLRDDIQWAFQALIDLDLSFDALGFPQHIPNFLKLVKRYPALRVVYDHCMKPQIHVQRAGEDAFTNWAEGMTKLADQTGGFCKLSALATEAGDGWRFEDLQPFATHVLKCFGPERVMFGSDWPVCNLATDYASWHAFVQRLVTPLGTAAEADVFGGTARRFYRLD